MERQFREMRPETRQKISAKLRGKPKADSTKQKISAKMREYWKGIPSQDQGDFTHSGRIV